LTEIEIECSRYSKNFAKVTKEKLVNVTYKNDPHAQELRAEVARLRNQNKALVQKCQFQDSRTRLGAQNYCHDDEKLETGSTVRRIRRSAKASKVQDYQVQIQSDPKLGSRVIESSTKYESKRTEEHHQTFESSKQFESQVQSSQVYRS